jgi:hypothetical protein
MEQPVVIEVAAGAQRAKPEDGFGAGERPSGTGTPHPVLHQITASTLDHARRDRKSVGECAIVVQEPRVLDEIRGGLLDWHNGFGCGSFVSPREDPHRR